MMQAPPEQQDSPRPHWDRRFPGRFQWELDAFAEAEIAPSIDPKALASGRLDLSFEWPMGDKRIPLRAIYPDSYPRLRPHVYLTDPNFFPKRHYSPLDGNLCLLGRDTRQWSSSWSVPELLRNQLQAALENGPDEDPQGEPAEVWWNQCSRPDSYCLIDSDWSLLGVKAPGRMKLAYSVRLGHKSGEFVFCAVVKYVLDADGKQVAAWSGSMPAALQGDAVKEIEVTWNRSEGELLPKPSLQDQNIGLDELLNCRTNPSALFELPNSRRGQLHAFLYPTETEFRKQGESWLFVLEAGRRSAFYPNKKAPEPPDAFIIRTLRAGHQDLISRAPATSGLSTKSIALFGTGALGAPLTIELARSGVGELKLLDADVVEPGNTIRWPIGSSAWGRTKTQALADFIALEYPATMVSYVNHALGTFVPQTEFGDFAALDETIAAVDLVIDGTASFGTTSLIQDQARSRSRPLIALYASPSVAGGVVALFMPNKGCPVCLEWAWEDERSGISPPPGMFAEAELIQPTGCAERTFSGTFFDLQELSLQAMRVVAGFFAGGVPQSSSVVYTLAFEDQDGIRVPAWRKNSLPPHSQCSCHK
ncbi:ThiF family adenylyltransferase [Bradyrhizobium lupini]|uniref:ThiF family adenylyltransferase n=1 Tax=Rhizobium lupini TaxID=136996 RepID=UPI00366DB38B